MSTSESSYTSSDSSESETYDIEVDDKVLAESKESSIGTENAYAVFSAPYEG